MHKTGIYFFQNPTRKASYLRLLVYSVHYFSFISSSYSLHHKWAGTINIWGWVAYSCSHNLENVGLSNWLSKSLPLTVFQFEFLYHPSTQNWARDIILKRRIRSVYKVCLIFTYTWSAMYVSWVDNQIFRNIYRF